MLTVAAVLWILLFVAVGSWASPAYMRYVNLYQARHGRVPGLHTRGKGPIERRWRITTPTHWTILWRRHHEPDLEAARREYRRRMTVVLLIQIGGLTALIAAAP